MTSQSQPVTPVRVPKAATAYTPTTQDPDLRSQINTLLLREGHIEKIEQTLHHALHAHPSNWPQKVSLHALSLLRSGECTTFPTLMERVLDDIRRDTAAARLHPVGPNNTASNSNPDVSNSQNQNPNPSPGSSKAGSTMASASSPEVQRKLGGLGKANGTAMGKGKAAGPGVGLMNGVVVNGVGAGEGSMGLAVPQTVIEEGIRITRECLEQVCEVDE